MGKKNNKKNPICMFVFLASCICEKKTKNATNNMLSVTFVTETHPHPIYMFSINFMLQLMKLLIFFFLQHLQAIGKCQRNSTKWTSFQLFFQLLVHYGKEAFPGFYNYEEDGTSAEYHHSSVCSSGWLSCRVWFNILFPLFSFVFPLSERALIAVRAECGQHQNKDDHEKGLNFVFSATVRSGFWTSLGEIENNYI